jgi:hypothetical protein
MNKLALFVSSGVALILSGCLTTTPSSGTIGVNPDTATVATGTQQMFTAVLSGALSSQSVKWSVVGAGCSSGSCGTIDQSGNYTAPSSVPANPSIQVVATTTGSVKKSGFANVTIASPVTITISPNTTQTLRAGLSQPFRATVTNTTNTNVNWSISGAGCAGAGNPCGTILPATTVGNGNAPTTYTAPAILPTPPTVTITATSAADNTKSASVNVNLILSVSVTPNPVNVQELHAQPFTATVSGSTNQAVTWSLSGPNCSGATCGTIDASGNYTAPFTAPSPSPTVIVTATSQIDNTTSGSATVTVTTTGSGPASQLKGQYAFVYRGYPNLAGTPTVEAASLLFDGAGNILSGVEDDNDGTTAHTQQSVTGTYTFDVNDTNRGTISLTIAPGPAPVSTLKFAIVPHSGSALASTIYLTDFSGTVAGAGKMEAQDPAALSAGAVQSGGYAVSFRGGTRSGTTVASAVGRFDLSGGTLSNAEIGRTFADTVFGDCSANVTIVNPAAASTFSGSYTAVNTSTGRVTFSMPTATIGATSNLNLSFSGYVISANKVLLVETDTVGFTFVGSAEQQTPGMGNTSFSGTYVFLTQSNNGPGAGNGFTSPITTPTSIPASGTVSPFDHGEYFGNLDGTMVAGTTPDGLDTDLGYYSMTTSSNGLTFATLCPGTFVPRMVMYFVSPQKAFVWNIDSNLSNVNTFVSDMLGELDSRVGGPWGGQFEANIDGTYSFGFEGVEGTFTGGHTVTKAIAESGTVVITTTGTATPTGNAGDVVQTGTITFTMDKGDGSAGSTSTVAGTFTFDNDADGNADSSAVENHAAFAEIVYSSPPSFPVPNRIVVVSGNKLFFLRNGFDSNVAGVAEKQ